MKTKKMLSRILFVLLITVGMLGCSNENSVSCDEDIYLGVKDVTGPTEAAVNETITFNVSFEVKNSCGFFNSFYEDTSVANQKTITVLASYRSCSCMLTPATRTAPYTFKATTAGTYTLKFKITNSSFKTFTVVVS